ncbi:hypothetical protein PIB30_038484 [Stylosanthes scabra]|uniref:Uncharacterized protein n=1 Tax=Stylosanthes scabra TaxID=79078 RepID=A0ABU6QEP1_9FABA|nr:hypothetical protein [Stylosanthes scabra]
MTRNSETLVLITILLIIGLIIFSGNCNSDGGFHHHKPGPPPYPENIRKEHWPPGYYDQKTMNCIDECEDMFRCQELNEEEFKKCIVLCKEAYDELPSHH